MLKKRKIAIIGLGHVGTHCAYALALSGLVAKITKNYFDRKKGKRLEPMLSAYPDMNEEFKQDIMTDNLEMK